MIETLDDWNERLAACGCCEMPGCPVPVQECESIQVTIKMPGFWHDSARWSKRERGVDEETFADLTETEYQIWTGSSYSGTIAGDEFTSQTIGDVSTVVFTEAYVPRFEVFVDGRVQCLYQAAPLTYTCDGTYVRTTLNWVGTYSSVYGYHVTNNVETTETWYDAGGEETDDHIQWELDHAAWLVLFPTPEDYQDAVDAYDAAVIAYDAAVIVFEEDYAQWLIDYDAWIAGGEVGDPPEEPVPPVPPVPPQEEPIEPEEFYEECTWKKHTLIRNRDVTYDGAGLAIGAWTTTFDNRELVSGPPGTLTAWTYDEETTTVEARAEMEARLTAADFDTCAAQLGDAFHTCAAAYEVRPADGSLELMVVGDGVRYCWVIPDTFAGSYFKITWDVLEEPDGWNATINDPGETLPDPLPEGYDTAEAWWAEHQVPDPAAPDRSFVSEDNTWEWTGPGDPEDEDSWKSGWYSIDPPSVPGTRRVVNIRFECYRSDYGSKPEITGEGVTLPDP